jgi:hypothetical protein
MRRLNLRRTVLFFIQSNDLDIGFCIIFIRRIGELLSRQTRASNASLPVPLAEERITDCVYISKWVDYSNKYGLGYQLTNGSVGVLFNDGTKMVLAPDQRYILYNALTLPHRHGVLI